MLRWLLTLALVLVTAGCLLAWGWYRHSLEQPMLLPADEVLIEVTPGASLRRVAAGLQAQGILHHPLPLLLHARLTGDDLRIRAGEYALYPGTTPRELLELLISGRVKLHPVTLVEGWTIDELIAAIERHPALRSTLETRDPETLAEVLGLPTPHAEGWFFPDTYLVPRGTRDTELLRKAHGLMKQQLERAWEARRDDLPLAEPYELLILASIIERETGRAEERSKVAGVFVRRLERGMRLQTDPTVIYGLGPGFRGPLTRTHLNTDTPWNTYTRAGLPPTPIALPGAAALHAAASPAEGDALFFVATGKPDGSHTFSATLDEHNAAVRIYRERLRRQRAAQDSGISAP
ncbi:MAG: endolytic transglycosylase MltG [Chromatiales bacterium]|nr:endolytic transglycosylase MltG [Chromatiales bacterium]